MKKILAQIYYDISHPAGYSSVQKLYKAAKKIVPSLTLKQVKLWLKHQTTYTRHHNVKIHFLRRKTLSKGIDHIWQIDLCDMTNLSRSNGGYKFLLTVIDVLSRYAFVRPLKNKTGLEVSKAIEHIFQTEQRYPSTIGVDHGVVFYNRNVKALLSKYNIKLYSVYSDPKMALIERFNRTLKSKMWKYFTRHNTEKYIDILQNLVNAYNNSKHRIIGMTPLQVNKKNENILWKKLYQKDFLKSIKYKFNTGDYVRISKIKKLFEKGYLPNWTSEIFIVQERHATNPVTYKLRDLKNEKIAGSFYEVQMLPVGKPKLNILEQIDILRTRKQNYTTQYYIHYKGWDSRFDEWIDKEQITSI
jgi:transposase InsO family protein